MQGQEHVRLSEFLKSTFKEEVIISSRDKIGTIDEVDASDVKRSSSTVEPVPTPVPSSEPLAGITAKDADDPSAAKPTGQRGGSKAGTRSKAQSRKSPKNAKKAKKPEESAQAAEPRQDLTQRLLSIPQIDHIALGHELVSPEILAVLDSAHLGSPALLPSALVSLLAAVSATAGPNVTFRCDQGGAVNNDATLDPSLAIRVVLMTPEAQASVAPAILDAMYAAEADALDRWQQAADVEAEQRRTAARRRRLFEQAAAATIMLGSPPLVPSAEPQIAKAGPKRKLLISNQGSSAILPALAGGSGLLVINDRSMPSMPDVGRRCDPVMANLLNTAATGLAIAITDPTTGRTGMRPATISVIGVVEEAVMSSLQTTAPPELAATFFVQAASPPIVSDSSAVCKLMRQVRNLAEMPVSLRISEKAYQQLVAAAAEWAAMQRGFSPPLSHYFAALPDLAKRIAAGFHMAEAATGSGKPLAEEIPPAVVKRAIALVNAFAIPTARVALERISCMSVERDAMRIVAYLRATTSPEHPIFERRQALRAWQRTMTVAALDAAIGLLRRQSLLTPLDKTAGGPGGQRFDVASSVYTKR
jgi:hypothetical protein